MNVCLYLINDLSYKVLFLSFSALVDNVVSFGEYTLKVGGVAKIHLGPLPVYG